MYFGYIEAKSHSVIFSLSLQINSDFSTPNTPLTPHFCWVVSSGAFASPSSVSHLWLTPARLASAVSASLKVIPFKVTDDILMTTSSGHFPFPNSDWFLCLIWHCWHTLYLWPLISFVSKQGKASWKWFLLWVTGILHILALLALGEVVHSKVLATDTLFLTSSLPWWWHNYLYHL